MSSETPSSPSVAAVSLWDSFVVWLRVSLLSFGGPAAQIAVMHRIIVDEKKWLDERRFLHALNFCMLLPGPEAQQLATYIGWLMHGVRGGLMAGLLFILPGFISILLLSLLLLSVLGCGGPPALESEEAILTTDALYTAITSRRTELLDDSAGRLKKLRDDGQLSAKAFEALADIIQQARDGKWQDAAEDLDGFIRQQPQHAHSH